jgi:ADP-ribosylation factor-binding protein GGA
MQQQLQSGKPSDPFAALSGSSTSDPFSSLKNPTPRQASPFQFQQSISTPPPNAQLATGPLPVPSTSAAPAASGGDDEWTFASALPDQSSEITVTNSSVNVLFNLSRQPDNHILISSRISNNTAQPVAELMFQVAVTKVSFFFLSYSQKAAAPRSL